MSMFAATIFLPAETHAEEVAVKPIETAIDAPELTEVSVKNRIKKVKISKERKKIELLAPNNSADIPITSSMKELAVSTEDSGGTLLLSDSPEYVKENGILYTDVVKGDARILFYHLNNSYGNKKVAIVLENLTNRMNKIEISRGGVASPSGDFLKVGKEVQMKYFNQPLNDTLYILGKTTKLLRDEMDEIVLQPGELIYGVYDFHTTQEVRVSVLFYPATAKPLLYYKRAPIQAADEYHLRGTFKGMNRTIKSKRAYDPEKDGTVYFQIGDDVNDKYKKGYDAIDGVEVTNFGNYGILYTLDLPTKKETQFYLCPLGGVYAGAMRTKSHPRSDLRDPYSKLILTPDGKKFFGDMIPTDSEALNQFELSDLGKYKGDLYFEYSPPGASNLPVNIILQPAQ